MKYNFEEFKTAFREGNLKVGDKLITTDLCGDAIFEVADIRKKKIFMVREYVLPDHDKDHNELMEFLNNEYLMSLPVEISSAIKQRDDNFIFVPREVEVFGKHEFSDPNKKGRQWKLFEKTKGRIRTEGDAYGPARFWWLCLPTISHSYYFCGVTISGTPNYSNASNLNGVLPCFIINPKALTENDIPEITENCIACKYDEDDEKSERCEKCLAGDSQFELDDVLFDEFKEPTTKNDSAVDVPNTNVGDIISRQAAIDAMATWDWQDLYLPIHFQQLLEELPPVTPQESRKGYWITHIKSDRGGDYCPTNPYCSVCGGKPNFDNTIFNYKYCPYCGSYNGGDNNENV